MSSGRGRWKCPVKDCDWWIGPWDENQEVAVLWYIINHLGFHIADSTYRWKASQPIDQGVSQH